MKWIPFFFLLIFSPLFAEKEFGYVTYSVTNIGDYIQSIAAKRFWPNEAVGIDRELIGSFEHANQVNAIVNSWFMLPDIAAPEKSWPPASSINPLLISLHFWEGFIPYLLTPESIAYLKEHAPVGARDLATLKVLEQHEIPAFFSGCLTLTLENPYKDSEREEVIYAVDIERSCVRYIRKHSRCKVVELSHIIPELPQMSESERLTLAESYLEKYRKAKCVVTKRFHAAMPCLAFGTPVLFIDPKGARFEGTADLLHTCTKYDLVKGKVKYNFNQPPKNKTKHLQFRENLNKVVAEWVENQKKPL